MKNVHADYKNLLHNVIYWKVLRLIDDTFTKELYTTWVAPVLYQIVYIVNRYIVLSRVGLVAT